MAPQRLRLSSPGLAKLPEGLTATYQHLWRRFLETVPEPDEPDASKAPLYGARPLLAVVPGDTPVNRPGTLAEPGAAGGEYDDGACASGLLGSSPPHANVGLGGSLGASSGPVSPAWSGPGAGGACGGGGGAEDRVVLYSLRKHCYSRELTFGGRVLPVL